MFFLRTYLWIAPNVLLLLTLVGIFRRKRRTQHPVFATYVVSQLAYFLSTFTFALVAARNAQSRTVYLWMLVVGLGLSAILEMAVLYELTAKLIFSRLRNSSTLRTIFRWAMGLLVLLGVVAAASVGSSGPERLINVFQNLNIGVYVKIGRASCRERV